eukprot:TRINITY_DN2578_c0_g1_i3.p1 TRINITY_DN2578_c0_g1~~TRINITY_DN2578_c0_g1_i3.p1  ORF type:complete len:705 (+),score=175.64 TRINITY_DN2578_c0_g1_i3:2058-4172(+)
MLTILFKRRAKQRDWNSIQCNEHSSLSFSKRIFSISSNIKKLSTITNNTPPLSSFSSSRNSNAWNNTIQWNGTRNNNDKKSFDAFQWKRNNRNTLIQSFSSSSMNRSFSTESEKEMKEERMEKARKELERLIREKEEERKRQEDFDIPILKLTNSYSPSSSNTSNPFTSGSEKKSEKKSSEQSSEKLNEEFKKQRGKIDEKQAMKDEITIIRNALYEYGASRKWTNHDKDELMKKLESLKAHSGRRSRMYRIHFDIIVVFIFAAVLLAYPMHRMGWIPQYRPDPHFIEHEMEAINPFAFAYDQLGNVAIRTKDYFYSHPENDETSLPNWDPNVHELVDFVIPRQMVKPFTLIIDPAILVRMVGTPGGGYVLKTRPGYDYFLSRITKYYEIVLFTGADEEGGDIYGDLDPDGNRIQYIVYGDDGETVDFVKRQKPFELLSQGKDIDEQTAIDEEYNFKENELRTDKKVVLRPHISDEIPEVEEIGLGQEVMTFVGGLRFKDYNRFERPGDRLVILDSEEYQCASMPRNCLSIPMYTGDSDDRILLDLTELLLDAAMSGDTRTFISNLKGLPTPTDAEVLRSYIPGLTKNTESLVYHLDHPVLNNNSGFDEEIRYHEVPESKGLNTYEMWPIYQNDEEPPESVWHNPDPDELPEEYQKIFRDMDVYLEYDRIREDWRVSWEQQKERERGDKILQQTLEAQKKGQGK